MAQSFDAEKAAAFDATVQFDLSGEGGGEWYVVIRDGTFRWEEGVAAAPTSTVKMDVSDYADMLSGELNPMTAFIQQKVRVEGDLNTVLKFQSLFA